MLSLLPLKSASSEFFHQYNINSQQMDFWNIANASVHQVDQCLNLNHIYSEEIELHICRLQQVQKVIRDLQNTTDNFDNTSAWLEGIESLLILLQK